WKYIIFRFNAAKLWIVLQRQAIWGGRILNQSKSKGRFYGIVFTDLQIVTQILNQSKSKSA
ncbi:MAG: hypothetical protein II908_08285, partial [Bacteroidaceae bacterium]|nr:hypothetical protein [Bacteroidaceae bacterium]